MSELKLILAFLIVVPVCAIFFYRLGQSSRGLSTSIFLPILTFLLLLGGGFLYYEYFSYPKILEKRAIANRVNIMPTKELLVDLVLKERNNRLGWAAEKGLELFEKHNDDHFYLFTSEELDIRIDFGSHHFKNKYFLYFSNKGRVEAFLESLPLEKIENEDCSDYYQLADKVFLCYRGYDTSSKEYQIGIIREID